MTPADPVDPRRRLSAALRERPVEVALAVLVALALVPVWAFTHFPSQDGPSHVYNAWVLLRLDDPSGPYGEVYTRHTALVPNLLGTLTLTALGRVLPLALAEKVLVSLCVVLGSLGVALLARGDEQRVPPVALLGPLFAYGYALHMGFYGYSLGAALVPLGWAIAWRHRNGRGPRTPALIGLLGLIAWSAHLVAAAMLALGVLTIALGQRQRRALVRLALPLLPTAALGVWYVAGLTSTIEDRWSAAELLGAWISLRGLVAYAGAQRLVASVTALLLLVALVHHLRRDRPTHASTWLTLGALTALVYAVVPNGNERHWFLSERLSLFPWLALLPLVRLCRGARLQLALCALLTVLALATALPHHAGLDADLRAYRALAAHTRPGRTVLSLTFLDPHPDARPAARARPFLHAAGWLAVDRDLVDAGNYEARTDHFQTRLRPGIAFPDPVVLEVAPTRVDLRGYPTVDYLVTRDLDAHAPAYRHRVEALFREVARSERNVLFARRR